jgi:hypothetical protein
MIYIVKHKNEKISGYGFPEDDKELFSTKELIIINIIGFIMLCVMLILGLK